MLQIADDKVARSAKIYVIFWEKPMAMKQCNF